MQTQESQINDLSNVVSHMRCYFWLMQSAFVNLGVQITNRLHTNMHASCDSMMRGPRRRGVNRFVKSLSDDYKKSHTTHDWWVLVWIDAIML